ncbi:hypothetical protein RJT34_23707 [Clitoria ternatea]|uniref:Uncharacterized protein n=1 Tax=Clitoria ternatea TaxID=43366 RepID=A0AAN9FLI6_CLITE
MLDSFWFLNTNVTYLIIVYPHSFQGHSNEDGFLLDIRLPSIVVDSGEEIPFRFVGSPLLPKIPPPELCCHGVDRMS